MRRWRSLDGQRRTAMLIKVFDRWINPQEISHIRVHGCCDRGVNIVMTNGKKIYIDMQTTKEVAKEINKQLKEK